MKFKNLFKALTFVQLYNSRWICRTPIGIFIIDACDADSEGELNYNCYLEQEVSRCPENSISSVNSLEDAKKECQGYFEKELAPFVI